MIKRFSINYLRIAIVAILMTVFASTIHAQSWQQYANPNDAGWSKKGLSNVRQQAIKIGSAAVLIVHKGTVVEAWGHVDHPYKTASIRKSIYDITFGVASRSKQIDTSKTIHELGLTDLNALSASEKQATLEQLLRARSGIFHPAAYESKSNADRRPDRGQYKPGEYWYYNNWDFNLVSVAFHEITGEKLSEVFSKQVARSLELEDFRDEHFFECFEPRLSKHPALTLRMSARDLARLGLLYLNQGKWGEEQIVDKNWIDESWSPHTIFEPGHYRGEGRGYGRLWWVFKAQPSKASTFEKYDRFLALGAGGQSMAIIPELDLLIVHLADTDNSRGVSAQNVENLMGKIIDTCDFEKSVDPNVELKAVRTISLQKSIRPKLKNLSPIPAAMRARLAGKYLQGRMGVELYEDNDRLFAKPIQIPVNDIELLFDEKKKLTSPIANVTIEVKRQKSEIVGLQLSFRGRVVALRRIEK